MPLEFGDDIPFAERERRPIPRPPSRRPLVLLGTLALVACLAAAIALIYRQAQGPMALPQAASDGTLFGHHPYPEAARNQLAEIEGVKLRPAALKAFRAMQHEALAAGVRLVPLSGFRSVKLQQDLYFGVKAERNQSLRERAKVSAPPGYSEHHTGYALDIGDGDRPWTNVAVGFDLTPAFLWLQTHANQFHFELSFPRGNAQGVSYEPWHWRFVGDPESLKLFHRT
jgi:zinc D-Ala-D-Ala carboxypeptidase